MKSTIKFAFELFLLFEFVFAYIPCIVVFYYAVFNIILFLLVFLKIYFLLVVSEQKTPHRVLF